MFGFKHRLQEGEGAGGGAGAGAGASAAAAAGAGAAGAAQPAEWLKPFGEHAKAFEGVKDPAELATQFTELKGKKFDFRSLADPADDKASKFIARFTDDKSFMKTVLEAQDKIRSGELAKPLDMKTAKPEEVKAWREANGIPLEPKGYFEKLPQGVVIGKEDQPAFDRYGKIWHQFNLPPAAAHAMAQAYYEDQTAVATAERKLDDSQRLKVTGELRTLWGKDFDANEAIVSSFLEPLGQEGKAMFMDAVLPNGERLWNNRQFREFLAKQAREINPLAHVVPGGGEGDLQSVESEIAGLEKLMGVKNSEYWKGPKAEKMQQRYRDLVIAQSKAKSRAA